jgi:hypothetical protein
MVVWLKAGGLLFYPDGRAGGANENGIRKIT